ncbi:MAG: hypothetical protein K0Q96_1845 [Rubrobacteraceae bacterium]|nr:hypothetical protein [Rubrobacteraceae bacterium]
MALALGVEVLGHDDGGIEVLGQGGDQPGERPDPTGGRSDYDKVRNRVVRQCSSLLAVSRVFP